MPEFKDKEEYEKWKTDNVQTNIEKPQTLKEENKPPREEQETVRQQEKISEKKAQEIFEQKVDKTIGQWQHATINGIAGKGGIILCIAGIILLTLGFSVSPLYYFSGVCFVMAALLYGLKMILVALADLVQCIKANKLHY